MMGKQRLKPPTTNHLLQLDKDNIDNRNINTGNLANKGLHLNPAGLSCLVKTL